MSCPDKVPLFHNPQGGGGGHGGKSQKLGRPRSEPQPPKQTRLAVFCWKKKIKKRLDINNCVDRVPTTKA